MIDPAITALRLAVRANGWPIIPTLDKRCFIKGWPHFKQDDKSIAKWVRGHWPSQTATGEWGPRRPYTGTGILVRDGVLVLDLDINHQATLDAIANAILDRFPHLDSPTLLVRYGSGVKEAWFLRTDEPFRKPLPVQWLPPGSDPADDSVKGHAIEVFGGGGRSHYCGAFGPCRIADDSDTALVAYRWDGASSPATVPRAATPLLTKRQCLEIIGVAAEVLRHRDWVKRLPPRSRGAAREPDTQRGPRYVLTPDMTFEETDGAVWTLAELEEYAARGWAGAGKPRFEVSPVPWLRKSSESGGGCLVGRTASGRLCIWDCMTEALYMPASLGPREIDLEELSQVLRRIREVSHA